jgi:DNA polymerase-1
VLDAGRSNHDISDLAQSWLGHQTILRAQVAGTGKAQVPFDCALIEKAAEYASEQADVILRLWKVLKARLAAEHVTTVYETLERPLIPVLGRMEGRGIAIDRQVLSRLSGEFAQKQGGLEDEINKLAGGTLNPGSPKQLGDVLFGQMNLPGGTKTKSGQWATGARVLEELAEQGHELPRKILDWRQVSKLRSTYTEALPGYVNAQTHRVHTCYALAATTTGRLSSSEPNLQNIPIRSEEGRKIRRAMTRIEPALSKAKLSAKMLLQVHDELIFEVPEGEVQRTLPVVKKVMEDAPMPALSLSVPLQVDARAAANWDEAH